MIIVMAVVLVGLLFHGDHVEHLSYTLTIVKNNSCNNTATTSYVNIYWREG